MNFSNVIDRVLSSDAFKSTSPNMTQVEVVVYIGVKAKLGLQD